MLQEEALAILKMGHTAFLTGSAGSGKTYLLNQFLDWLSSCKVPYAVTASTGIAATHIGGQTLHSWSGLGIKKRLSDFDLDLLEENKTLWDRWSATEVLVVDEVSMLSADQLDALDAIGRSLRRRAEPFGGVAVVFSGDFFQLPPVERDGERAQFAWEARVWQEVRPVVCYLEGTYRHESDAAFGNLLNDIRSGRAGARSLDMLNTRRAAPETVSKNITRLYTHNADVDAENDRRLADLSGNERVFLMRTKGKRHIVESLVRGCLAPETLRLKKSAEVMFVKNDPSRGYVNGTRGIVLDFENGLPIVKTRGGRRISVEPASWRIEERGTVRAEITQVPLRLAWAITVHKSQGMTLDEAFVDLSGAFVPGQGYVALSRVRSLEGLYIGGLNDTALAVDGRVLETDGVFRNVSDAARARLREIALEDREKRHREFVKSRGGSYTASGGGRKDSASRVRQNVSTHERTKALVEKGMSVEEIADARGLSAETIVAHLEKLICLGDIRDVSSLELVSDWDALETVRRAAEGCGWERLAPLREELRAKGRDVSYGDLRRMRIYDVWRNPK